MKEMFAFKSLIEFTDYFRNERICADFLAKVRFRDGEFCPHCHHDKIYKYKNGLKYRCAKCRFDFGVRNGTVFGDSKLPLRKWLMAIYLLNANGKGISSHQLAKHIKVSQKTAWFVSHRIRSGAKQNTTKLSGIVEVDETYVGGLQKNRHVRNRIKGTQGRSPKAKVPVMGIIQRGGEVRAKVVERVTMEAVETNVTQNVATGTRVMSDDFLSYAPIKKLYPYQAVSHARGEYVRGDAHTNSIESFWAVFKRAYKGVYHVMSRKHMQRYFDEFCFRFNRRTKQAQEVFHDAVVGMLEGRQLPFKTLIQGVA